MSTPNLSPSILAYEAESKLSAVPAPLKGWLPPSFDHTFEVKNFIEDIRKYSGEDKITPKFRKNNPYISYYLCKLGNLSLLKAWFNNDCQAIAEEFLVKPLKESEQKMRAMDYSLDAIHQELKRSTYFLVSLALRNSSEEDVREVTNTGSNLWPESKSFTKGKEDAFKSFERWGCQIARYRKPKELNDLKARYAPLENGVILLANEIAYGEKCYQEAEEALKLCMNEKAVPTNKELDFLNTKPERQGMRIALEYMIERHYLNAVARKNDDAAVAMKTIRKVICYTPLGPYNWAGPLTEEMLALANSSTVADMKPDDYEGQSGPGYVCTYMGHVVHKFFTKAKDYDPKNWLKLTRWDHGIVSLDTLWPRLEELHYEIMNMVVDTSNRDSLRAFYDKVIEATWLLGNLTPTHRGTGKTVEQTLTLYHLRHNLRTPLLRLENPQIDVLNITLPLSEYKKRFFNYFEPESLPPPVLLQDKKRQEALAKFDVALEVIKARYEQLIIKKGKKYEDLVNSIKEASKQLNYLRGQYKGKIIDNPESDQKAYLEFKDQCKKIIDPLKPQLETHRGLKGFCIIQLIMTAVDALLAIFSKKWSKNSFFHHRTRTAESFDPLVQGFENDFNKEYSLSR